MTTIAQHAASHDMTPAEVADFLSIASSYSNRDQLSPEALDALNGDVILAEVIGAYLAEWGFDHAIDGARVTVGDWSAVATRGLPRATSPTGDSYETGDAERAAMLLALPIARTIWDTGRDDISVDYFEQATGEVEVNVGRGVTLRTPYDEVGTVIVADHPLGISDVAMADLSAILESAELAYGDPLGAWQTLCEAADFEHDTWEQTVEALNDSASFQQGDRFTRVDSCRSERTALVEDWQEGAPLRVIDVESVSDCAYWAPSDAAAAVLNAIA